MKKIVTHQSPDIDSLVACCVCLYSQQDYEVTFVPMGTKKQPKDNNRIWIDVGGAENSQFDHHGSGKDNDSAVIRSYNALQQKVKVDVKQRLQSIVSVAHIQDLTGKALQLMRNIGEVEEPLKILNWLFEIYKENVDSREVFEKFKQIFDRYIDTGETELEEIPSPSLPTAKEVKNAYSITGNIAVEKQQIKNAKDVLVSLGIDILVKYNPYALTILGLDKEQPKIEKRNGLYYISQNAVQKDVGSLLPILAEKESEWFSPFPAMVSRGISKQKVKTPTKWKLDEIISLCISI